MAKHNIQAERNLDRMWLRHIAALSVDDALAELNSNRTGLSSQQVERALEEYGPNEVLVSKRDSAAVRFIKSFADPFVLILIIVAIVSLFTDVLLVAAESRDFATPIIIVFMVLISGVLRYVQETRSGDAAEALAETIETTCNVERSSTGRKEIPLDEVVVGDIVHLAAGDIAPADMRVISSRDLFVGQASLTGEADAVEKFNESIHDESVALTDINNLIFLGTTVISGTGICVVAATGSHTFFGSIARGTTATQKRTTTSNQGIQEVSQLLLRLMLIMAPVVLLINGFTKGDWLQSLLFSLSVAVGLTPEMLPMIVATCLAKGAVDLSHQKVIVKRLEAVQDLGAVNILCTDKTGTLTEDSVALEHHLDVHGNEDARVLAYAFLNSFLETGLRNLIDSAIIKRAQEESLSGVADINVDDLAQDYYLIDELPFDFERRRVSVVVGNKEGQTLMISKGAIEEILACCTHAEYHGKKQELSEELIEEITERACELAEQGFRVLGLATKENPASIKTLTTDDESAMVLVGYLAFLDPPKESAGSALAALAQHGVETKVLTGDSTRVARYVCSAIGLEVTGELEGVQIETMSDDELMHKVQTTTLFSKLSPDQKVRVVEAFRAHGHAVAFMGDGVNDAPAMRASDCGISVDSAVDIAKESADIILLEKDLNVLEHGIESGRRTSTNMEKYIRITASSNFGNIFSVLAASLFLPFLPMTAVQLLLLNLINDIVCAALPWDKVSDNQLESPLQWNTQAISRYMRFLGPVSSIFDIVSFVVLFSVICPHVCGASWSDVMGSAQEGTFIGAFQAGWFFESLITQIVAIFLLRKSSAGARHEQAAWQLIALSGVGIALGAILAFTHIGSMVDFVVPSVNWLAWLVLIVMAYACCIQLLRRVTKL